MNEELLSDEAARELANRVTLLIYVLNRPLARLARDVAGVERFDAGDGPLTPPLRLTCAFPPLTPPAAAVVDAAVRAWGHALFSTQSGRMLVKTLAFAGPIGAAEAFVLQMEDRGPNLSHHVLETGEAFRGVFARHPNVFLQGVRALLAPFVH